MALSPVVLEDKTPTGVNLSCVHFFTYYEKKYKPAHLKKNYLYVQVYIKFKEKHKLIFIISNIHKWIASMWREIFLSNENTILPGCDLFINH